MYVSKRLAYLIPVLGISLGACAGEGPDEPLVTTAPVPLEATDGAFTFDSSALRTRPAGQLPSRRLAMESYGDRAVRDRLIRTREDFTIKHTRGQRMFYESGSWVYEQDTSRGRVLALRKTAAGPATRLRAADLQRQATARLGSWGIGSGEVYRILQRKLMKTERPGNQVARPEVFRHKTFVFRGLGGVRVEGSRAVVTHTLDGAINRVLIAWPPLASAGHLLRTNLSVAEMQRRAAAAMRKAGETRGKVTLRYKYVPASTDSGEIVLTLKVNARLARPADDSPAEPREVEVDVSAVQ